MNKDSYMIKVPGKLMVAGEYAVLKPGFCAVAVAVNRYVTAEIKLDESKKLNLPQLRINNISWTYSKREGIVFEIHDNRLRFVKNAMEVVCQYLTEIGISLKSFSLHIKSDLNDPITGKKYGLGSSAAIVVSVVSAILTIHGEFEEAKDLEKLFKLSAIAHLKTQRNGSGTDVAVAVYGGWLQYGTYSSKWLLKALKKEKSITNIINKDWPHLLIKRITPPKELKLAIGWTRESVGTANMVKRIEAFQEKNKKVYEEFLEESKSSVSALIDAFRTENCEKAIHALYKNRMALNNLGNLAGVNIETEKIKILCTIADNFGRGKSSGAGGGDCGIAFVEGVENLQKLFCEWQEAGITPLDLEVTYIGCKVY